MICNLYVNEVNYYIFVLSGNYSKNILYYEN